jgi:hypothetical protein
MWTNTFWEFCINKNHFHFILDILSHMRRAAWMEFVPLLGNITLSLSLMLWLSFVLWSKVVRYLLEALFLAMVMKILGN